MKACREVTHACLEEEKEPTPEETEAVEKPQEVPKGGTDEETSAGTEDRTGEQRLAVRRHRQRKKRAQVNGGPRQKFAAARRRFTRRAVPAMRKVHVRRGPGMKCRRRGIRGPGKTSGTRMKVRDMKQRPRLGRGRTLIEALGQTFGLEVVERTVGSSTRLRRPSIWKLWKCRPHRSGRGNTTAVPRGTAAVRRREFSRVG
jgi:hypothetical protein